MKYTLSVCLILLLSVICGCSKPEPPAAKAPLPAKKPAAKKYIQTISAVTSETYYTEIEPQAMAPVRVTDTDTGLPITHASVRVRWISDDGPIMCSGIHIEDGNYQVPTNGLKGVFYVGALADGYLPDDKENPRFPVELSMKEGETIEVSGTIYHANGDPVTNGIINLRMIDTYLWGTKWPLLYPCSVTPDNKGGFILSHVPSGIDVMYAKYDLPKNSAVYFKDQTFSTSDGDVHLALQLPPELTIKGRVLFSSGSAVSGAWIWTELVTGEAPDAWNKKLADKKEAVSGVAVQSDADGYFELRVLKIMDRYVVKADHPPYAVVYSGPYSDSTPPVDPIELIIQEKGARLFGSFSTSYGQPITNCTLQYSLLKKISQSSVNIKYNKVLLDIVEDGSYISGTIPPGSYTLDFTVPGYYQQSKKVVIQENATEQCDVIFTPCRAITGTVFDAETKLPIPDVLLTNKHGSKKGKNVFSQKTDETGKFWVYCDNNYVQLEFQHPKYAPLECYFSKPRQQYYSSSEENRKEYCPEIFLSKAGALRVFGRENDGTPLNVYGVQLQSGNKKARSLKNTIYLGQQWVPFVEGEALLTNIPVMYSPVCAEVCTKNNGRAITKSDLVDITAGEETTVTVTLPPTGSLVVRFLNPIEHETIDINGYLVEKSASGSKYIQRFGKHNFTAEKQKMSLNETPTNVYKVIIKGKPAISVETNILITANNTTEVLINNDTNVLASISGTVTTHEGGIIQCSVSVYEQSTGKQIEDKYLYYDSSFTIEGLSRDSVYDLSVKTYEGSRTNILIKSIVPGGPDLNITLPVAYRITGNVIDGDGNPLKAMIGIMSKSEQGPGEFKLYNVFPGTYSLRITAREYLEVVRTVTVNDSDVDLGDIVLDDKGITISGRIVTKDNVPVGNARIKAVNKAAGISGSAKTDDSGCFQVKYLPRDMAFYISVNNDKAICDHQTDVLDSDTDIGDLILNPLPYYIVTVVTPEGEPVTSGYINNQKIGADGTWQGHIINNIYPMCFLQHQFNSETTEKDIYKIPITHGTDATNSITITIPASYMR